MKKDIIESIEKVNNIKFSSEQLDILNSYGGLRIISGAGAGKTSLLVSLLVTKLHSNEISPEKVLCCTFSKAGATEMKNKFKSLCDKLGLSYNIDFRTIHSMYYDILRELGYSLKVVSDITKYVRRALKENEICSKIDVELEDYIKNLISYQINTATPDKDLENCSVFDRTLFSLDNYLKVRDSVNKYKTQDGVVDYDDIQKQVYILLYSYNGKYANLVLDYCKSKWKYYFIDEFQDTGMIQYKILNKIVTTLDKDNLTVIGDDDQSIYVWRGTNPNLILEDVIVDYGLDTKVIPINYRCKSEIVNFASKSICNNVNRKEKDLKAFKEGGKVELVELSNYSWYNLSLDAFNKIKDLSKSNNLSDIAVLCRNNNQLQLLNLMLYMSGIQTSHLYGMKFTNSEMYNDCKSLLDLLDNTKNLDWVRSNLYKFTSYCNKDYNSSISDLMGRYDCGIKEAISAIVSVFGDGTASEIDLSPREKELLCVRAYGFNARFKESLYELYEVLNSKMEFSDRVGLLIDTMDVCLQFKYKNESYRRFCGFLDYFRELLKVYEVSELIRLLKDIEKLEYSSDVFDTDKVNFTTIHSAKGLEYKNVILFGCDNYSFPNTSYVREMMDSSGYSELDIRDYIDCERRLYYVGCTRAKDYLYISGDMNKSCYFLRESLGEVIGDDYILKDIKWR
jgi:ATP-dependent DNA helicase pcrA